MHVRFMQIVDRVIGVPLCFVCWCFQEFLGLFFKRAVGESCKKPKKVMFIELSEMGSAFIGYSALHRTVQEIGNQNTYFLIFHKNRESVDLLSVIPYENVLCIRDNSFSVLVWDTLKVLCRMWFLRVDAVVDMELFSRFTTLISFLSGAKIRVGFHNYTSEGLYRGNLLTHPILYNPHHHMVYNFLALVSGLFDVNSDLDDRPLVKRDVHSDEVPLPQVVGLDNEISVVKNKLKSLCSYVNDNASDSSARFILFNPDPGLALPIRGWPKENFNSLAKRIVDAVPNAIIVVMGLSSAKDYATDIINAVGVDKCVDFTGQTQNLREVVALFQICELLISNDSGPAHMAALAGIRSLLFYGPETPALYGPLSDMAIVLYADFACSPCLSASNHRHTICGNNKCLKAISVDVAFEHVMESLTIT